MKLKLYTMIYFIFLTGAMAGMVDKFMDTCEKGDMFACYQAGVAYWTGEGIVKDKNAAKSLFNISCEGGISDACLAFKTLNNELKEYRKSKPEPSVHKIKHYVGSIDGSLYGDIDNDGKIEKVIWKKFASADLGDYYQLLIIDDDGSLLWTGPKKKNYENLLIFYSLDIGESLPQLLIDFDQDGSLELLAPMAQSDVSPTYYRKLRWKGSYFEPLIQNALMLSSSNSNHFVWKKTLKSYGTWISKLHPYKGNLVKAYITQYNKDESVNTGIAIIKFNRYGAVVQHWLERLPIKQHRRTSIKHQTIGIVYGLDPRGDGFLSIRKKPRSREIGRLYNGDMVEILGNHGKWYKIKNIKSGKIGWSHSNWIKIRSLK